MTLKKLVYYFSKFTLIDEILGFIYWVLALYGMFLIREYIKSQLAIIAVIFLYIVTVVFLYIFLIKRVKIYLKGDLK